MRPSSSSSDSGSVGVTRLIPRELTTVDTNYSKTDINTLAAVGILLSESACTTTNAQNLICLRGATPPDS